MSELLKVGDKIVVEARASGLEIHTIERVTPTMYVCKHRRFRHDLTIVAHDQWGPFRGQLLTPTLARRFRLQTAALALSNFKVTNENLEAVEALLTGGAA